MFSRLSNFVSRLPKVVAQTGAVVIVVDIILVVAGAIFIASIENERRSAQFALIYAIIVGSFVLLNWLMFKVIYDTTHQAINQEKSRQQTLHDYQRSVVRLQVAAEIARDSTAEANLQGLLDRAVTLICERFDFYHAGIFLIDHETNYAVLRAVAGTTPASKKMIINQHQLKVGKEGIVGYVTSTGKARIVLDTAEDMYHYKNPVLPETASELALPFVVGERIIGALDVQSRERGAFDQDDISILQTMADLLAVAINKANLNETVLAYTDELEERVKQRTQELQFERAQLQVILDSMSDGLIYDEDLKVVYTNPALTKLTGYERDAWDGWLETVKPRHMNAEEFASLRKTLYETIGHHGFFETELKLMRHDGTEFDASIVCSAIQRDPETNHAKGAVTIIRDISQQKALDEQKSRFIANAAHELRTPLANMKTRLYLIRHQPDRFNEHYEILRKVTSRMQRLIDDLLDMSRFEQGKISLVRQPECLQDLILDVINTQRPEADSKSIDLSSNMPVDPLYADIDKDRMIQVLTNLVTNAINYTPDNGMVTVHLEIMPDKMVKICVEDSGIGIHADMLEKVFQPFVRVNYDTSSGTGLGLNIAWEIIRLHEGDMYVESEEGIGSRFYILLRSSNGEIVIAN